MRYPYPDANIPVGDDDDVYVEVIFPDAGTTGYTYISVPDGSNKGINNEGSVMIGKGKELKSGLTIITSNPVNIAPEIDKIRVTITAAGAPVVVHENLKSDDSTPQIEVCINFQ